MQSLSRRRAPTLSRHCDAWPSAGSSGRRGHRGRRGACLDLPLPGGGPGSGRVAVQPDQLISPALDGPIDYSWTSEDTVLLETIAGALSYGTRLMVERADAQEPPRSKSDPPPCQGPESSGIPPPVDAEPYLILHAFPAALYHIAQQVSTAAGLRGS